MIKKELKRLNFIPKLVILENPCITMLPEMHMAYLLRARRRYNDIMNRRRTVIY